MTGAYQYSCLYHIWNVVVTQVVYAYQSTEEKKAKEERTKEL